jgi:hypothetical protein
MLMREYTSDKPAGIDIPNDVRELRRFRAENAEMRDALKEIAEIILAVLDRENSP